MDQQKTLLQQSNKSETKARRISGYKIILDKKALQNHLAYPETISGNISLSPPSRRRETKKIYSTLG